MPILTSYGLAVRTGPRPRSVLHVQKNADAKALCGKQVIRLVDYDPIDGTEKWPYCERCCEVAGPETMSFWVKGRD